MKGFAAALLCLLPLGPRPLSNPRGPTGERRRRMVALLQEHPEGLSPVQTQQLLGLEKSLGSTRRST